MTETAKKRGKMGARDLGFASSWRMLTRDKGWIKPVLILTMVGWIPILGQIVLFGYGLEWARLTAWGVDSAPKQRGVDYGKVLESGGRAFLVTVTLGFVVALVLQVVFPGSLGLLISGFAGNGLLSSSATFSTGLAMSLLALAASLLMGSFLQAAALRATIYDSFSAGWRLDRLFQMICRDLGGFFRAVLVTWIGGAIAGAYTFVVALVLSMVTVGGIRRRDGVRRDIRSAYDRLALPDGPAADDRRRTGAALHNPGALPRVSGRGDHDCHELGGDERDGAMVWALRRRPLGRFRRPPAR